MGLWGTGASPAPHHLSYRDGAGRGWLSGDWKGKIELSRMVIPYSEVGDPVVEAKA